MESLGVEVGLEVDAGLDPHFLLEVESPKVLQVGLGFPSHDNHVLLHQAGSVVGPCSRHGPTLGLHLVQEHEVALSRRGERGFFEGERKDVVESLLVGLPTTEDVDAKRVTMNIRFMRGIVHCCMV